MINPARKAESSGKSQAEVQGPDIMSHVSPPSFSQWWSGASDYEKSTALKKFKELGEILQGIRDRIAAEAR